MLAQAALLLAAMLPAEHRLYACGATSKNYVVGAMLPPSGLFNLDGAAGWEQLGFNHPAVSAMDYDPRDPSVLFLAAGNGCIRASKRGREWRILTDWRATDLLDIALDRARPGAIWIALPDGIGFSADDGRTWQHRDDGIARKYVQAIRMDRKRSGRVLAGGEQGIFLSEDSGKRWRGVGAPGLMVTHLEQSVVDARRWLAATQKGGLFESPDDGLTWKPVVGVPSDEALYNAAFHPSDGDRIAACGWSAGVLLSEDGGRTWKDRSAGLPSRRIWRVSFDPDRPKRIWASVHEEAVFVSDDLGLSWQSAGLPGSIIRSFVFVPEESK